jgi:hypothetical protein
MNIFPDISKFLEKYCDHFKSQSPLKKKRFVSLILKSILRKNTHKYPRRFDDLNSISFEASSLQDDFGKSYQIEISHYIHKLDDDYAYNDNTANTYRAHQSNYTKRYKLKKQISDLLEAELLSNQCVLENSNKDKITKIRSVKKNAILKTYYNRKTGITSTCKTNISLPVLVKGNLSSLKQSIDTMKIERNVVNDYQKQILTDKILKLSMLYYMLNNTLKHGYIPQYYNESRSGRLVGRGLHLINISNEIRKIFFGGQNLYDYDLSNCHYSILSTLCRRNNVTCSTIDYYLNNKTIIRRELSDEFYLPEKKIKKALISIIYGSRLSPHNGGKMFGNKFDDLKKFKTHKIISGIMEEVKTARRKILLIQKYRKKSHGSYLYNSFDKYRKNNPVSYKENSSRFSHILLGYETLIMNEIWNYLKDNQHIDNPMTVIIYDGWIGKDIDINLVCAHIKTQLGFDIGIDKEKI